MRPSPSNKLVEQRAPQNLAAQLLTPAYLGKWPYARIFGYARVSTEEQVLDVQITKLREAGVQREDLFCDVMSGGNAHRDGFKLMRKQIQPGDFLLVYSASRIARDAKVLLTILDEMTAQGITVKSLTETLDLKTATGRMHITILAAVDEAERGRVRERTRDAMQEKKRQGMYLGAPLKITPTKARQMREMRKREIPVRKIAEKFGVSVSAVYGAL